jgi:hypothetical protein
VFNLKRKQRWQKSEFFQVKGEANGRRRDYREIAWTPSYWKGNI